MVYVIGQNGQPLMPTNRHGKVKHLLKSGKAKVIRKCPFTIKLLYKSTTYTQPLTLGVDTGSGTLGTAVADEKGNILYASEVQLRNDITEKMQRRSKYRRSRRTRKTRHRECRFLNRKNSKRKDRLNPTMTSKLNSHIKEIEFIKSILPITTLVLEYGQFDMHLMKNPMLANENIKHWGYQKGPNYGYENTKAMVLARDNYTCQCCKGKHKDSKLEVHHIIYRSKGGADTQDNLITLCSTCHKKVHNEEITLNVKGKLKGQLKYASQMNVIRSQLKKHYLEAIETYGCITKANRLNLGLPKEHYIDACVIATQGNQVNIKTLLYLKKSVAKGDFQKTKGIRSEKPITTGKICGFIKFDKILYEGKEYFIKGRMSSGYAILMDIYGNKIDFSYMPKGKKTPKLERCERIQARDSIIMISKVI